MSDVSIHVLDFIYAPAKADFAQDLRLQVEYSWIHTLRTTLPHGLNSMEKAPIATHCRNVTFAIARNTIKRCYSPATRHREEAGGSGD